MDSSTLLNTATRSLRDDDNLAVPIEGDPSIAREPRGGLCSRGSRWGTVFNTCAATLGAGAISLPDAMAGLGLVPGLVLLIVIGLATHYSIVLLVAVIGATGAPSFEELSEQVFGHRMRVAVELCIIIFCYGTCIAYTMFVGTTLHPLLGVPAVQRAMPWLEDIAIGSTTVGEAVLMVGFWFLFMLPLSFVEQMTSLQYTSLFGVLALMYLVLAVLVHFAIDASADQARTIGAVKLFNPSLDALSASSIIMFAFTCQVNIPSLYAELTDRTPKAMAAVSVRAVALCLLCYAVIGVAGYANFPTSVQSNILDNYCVLDPAASSFVPTPPRVIAPAYVAITLTVLMAYPVNVFPCRHSVNMLLFGRGEDESVATPRWKARVRHVSVTFAIAFTSLLVALVVPNITDVFSLVGGTAGAFTCYILPAAAAWRLRDRVPQMRSTLGRAACAGVFALGVLVGVLSTAVTIAGFFQPSPRKYDACNPTNATNATGPGDFMA